MALQLTNGYTRIVNEVLDQLVKRDLLGSELSLILFVIRKTWGYNKKEDIISLTQFEQGLNLSRPTVTKTIKNLVSRKILVKTTLLDKQKIAYKFNKYWKEWLVNPPLLVKNKWQTSKAGFTETSKAGFTHKRKKENKSGYLKFQEQKAQLIRKKSI